MTWTKAGTTSSAHLNAGDHWREVFDTYLSTRTGWTVDTPPGEPNLRRLSYTFTNNWTGADKTFYYLFKYRLSPLDGQDQYILYPNNDRYTTTPGDNYTYFNDDRDNTQLSTLSASGTHWHVWYSDQNDRAILVTYGSSIQFCWYGFESGNFCLPEAVWTGDGTDDAAVRGDGILMPHVYNWGMVYHGWPLVNQAGSGWVYPLQPYQGATSKQVNSAFVDSSPIWGVAYDQIQASDNQWTPLFQSTQNDVLMECPQAETVITNPCVAVLQTIQSEAKFYLRGKHDEFNTLTKSALLFLMGDSAPDLSLEP